MSHGRLVGPNGCGMGELGAERMWHRRLVSPDDVERVISGIQRMWHGPFGGLNRCGLSRFGTSRMWPGQFEGGNQRGAGGLDDPKYVARAVRDMQRVGHCRLLELPDCGTAAFVNPKDAARFLSGPYGCGTGGLGEPRLVVRMNCESKGCGTGDFGDLRMWHEQLLKSIDVARASWSSK